MRSLEPQGGQCLSTSQMELSPAPGHVCPQDPHPHPLRACLCIIRQLQPLLDLKEKKKEGKTQPTTDGIVVPG